ncbi:1-acyl-sn-glycerol-3-phosphate acyltransferase [Albidovulum sp.]|uniref:1-acyl-sn-glycerol-3-phosphate acyltransferase n=1 Tax=Albidovulum sp. TaxID=1872424 RepID=UPI002BD31D3D|nr:1-acyl-sn-glycerol-3-phosphate acyltransferase [Paracoccaceae bacterium]MCP5356011.1 1-acyl-sn-glycerol-3-phosphate acyltransferase [Paracoccaceae bacterium]HRV61699.1 1-acyl-sn-glycerol-3-phosphate acyltransferase [Albidovulum sp.]
MFHPVTLPLWLFVLILVFAGVTFASHFLFPSVRWFFRRRVERVVERLNARLDRPIEPFKLMARPDMIVRLTHDPKVAEAIVAEAEATGTPETVQLERARRYAREIVPAFSATVYFGFATRAAKWLARLVYRVRIGQFDTGALAAIDRRATVVFVMNHRSNMDYVLVTYLAADRSALSYAVGEWARVWPLSWLIRASGAYFIRRKSGNPLYRRVLARYVQMAAAEGVTQAIFPEGGLSLDGRVGRPKLGILSYIADGWRTGGRDVVFVPVSLAYDRVIEDRVLTAAHATGVRRFRASFGSILMFVGRQVGRLLTGRFEKFGVASVSFGTPLSLADFMAGPHDDATAELAGELMRRIARNVTVLPVPLLCAAIGEATDLPLAEVRARAADLAHRLDRAGVHLDLPDASPDAAVDRALDILSLRKIVRREGDRVLVPPKDRALIGFYAAPVRQHLCAPAASNEPEFAEFSPNLRS